MNPRSKNLLVVDVETTGTNPFRHNVMAIACVPFAGDIPTLELYVAHEKVVWSEYAKKQFDRYALKWETNAISAGNACAVIEQYLSLYYPGESVTLVGHNIGFDMAFLRKLAFEGGRDELAGISHRTVDTHTMLYVLYEQGKLPSSALTSDGAFRHFGIRIRESERHTALGDAFATKTLASKLFELLANSAEYAHSSPRAFRA